MAKGIKTGGRNFTKGNSFGASGRPRLPGDIRDARTYMREETERIVTKMAAMTFEQLQEFIKAKKGTVYEMAIASCYFKSVSRGETGNLNFFLDRIVGRPKQHVEVSGELTNKVQVSDDQLLSMAKEIAGSDKGSDGQ